MNESSTTKPALWHFIPVNEYTVPDDRSSVGRARKSFVKMMRGLKRDTPSVKSPLDPEQNLLRLSETRLEQVFPAPDWSHAAGELEQQLRPWLDDTQPSKPVIFYVAPPYAGRKEILECWAADAKVAIVPPPSTDQVLSGDSAWFRSWPKTDPWILPRLEKCLIRQADGLDLVRELLAQVLSGAMGRGVIGCDSWTWSFLQHVWLGRPSFTITADAFDATRLRGSFSRSIRGKHGSDLAFCRADNGETLLDEKSKNEADKSPDVFWRRLAAYSRGNIGVAAACWQRALRVVPDNDPKDNPDRSQQTNGEKTIWVAPWNELDLPSVPKDAGETSLFVMHALLLHGGLGSNRLAKILPSDRAAIVEALLFLKEARLVVEENAEWQVTACGYPAVRSILLANDFLCDPF